jgi:hypothetical protein
MLAYFYIVHEQENNISEEGLHQINIERIKREFKTHRSAIDFDEKFINHCFCKQESAVNTSSSGDRQQQRRDKQC